MSDDLEAPVRRSRFALSVRTRIVAAIVAVMALGLLAVGVSVVLVERQHSLEQIDARLRANLDSARFIVAEGEPVSGTWLSSSAALEAVVKRMSPDDNTGAMGMTDGVIRFVPGVDLDLDLQGESNFARTVNSLLDASEPIIATYAENGVAWRYLAAPIAVEGSPAPTEVVFVLVYDIEAELSEFDGAVHMFVYASLAALVVVAAIGTIVATRLLRPLRQMRETAERVSVGSLDERLPVVGNDDVAELAQTMNDMLDRLNHALDSQRQLLSDVGHELKTPLTIVHGYVEVMNPDDPADVRETQDLAIDELERMDRLVQDLAGAAALHGPSPVQLRSVDTPDLVQQIVRKAQGIVGAEVSVASVAECVASLDSARITQAMLQLVQNAVTHGGGRAEIGSRTAGSNVNMWVRDFGAGVPDAAKERVFERFQRGSDASGHSGSGLGLNIVQMIAKAHGGNVSVHDADGGGALFVISLPRIVSPGLPSLPSDLRIPPRPPIPARPPAADTGR